MKNVLLLIIVLAIIGCKGPEPRRPVEVKSGSFFKESVERNKALLEKEEKLIQEIIAKDTAHTYLASPNGFWYYVEKQNETSSYFPKTDDQILFSYNLVSFANDTLYTMEENGPTSYVVDKEQLFPGLQNAVKLLKINERATFLFPSLQAYGYHGDRSKIGPMTPIKSTVELHTIIINQDSLNLKP